MKKINFLIILILFAASFFITPYLPAQIPMHWNIRGEVDSYWNKDIAVWFIPVLTALMYISFRFIPKLDPKKDKYKLFQKEWEIMQTGLIGFFTYLQFVILYISLNPTVSMLPLMFIGLGALFILMGNYMSKIRQNYFIGVKLPWTLANEDNWNKTHRYASWCFVIAGIVTLSEAFFIWYAPVVIFSMIILSAILPMVYSFLLYKKAVYKMKYVYLGLILFALVIFGLRLVSGEDDWICSGGKWVMHGHPESPMPQTECK